MAGGGGGGGGETGSDSTNGLSMGLSFSADDISLLAAEDSEYGGGIDAPSTAITTLSGLALIEVSISGQVSGSMIGT